MPLSVSKVCVSVGSVQSWYWYDQVYSVMLLDASTHLYKRVVRRSFRWSVGQSVTSSHSSVNFTRNQGSSLSLVGVPAIIPHCLLIHHHCRYHYTSPPRLLHASLFLLELVSLISQLRGRSPDHLFHFLGHFAILVFSPACDNAVFFSFIIRIWWGKANRRRLITKSR